MTTRSSNVSSCSRLTKQENVVNFKFEPIGDPCCCKIASLAIKQLSGHEVEGIHELDVLLV